MTINNEPFGGRPATDDPAFRAQIEGLKQVTAALNAGATFQRELPGRIKRDEAGQAPTWLVEIRLEDWIFCSPGIFRTVAYEEVIAWDEIEARHAAFEQFEKRCKYEPIMKRKMLDRQLSTLDCCAADAVALDGLKG